MKTPADAEHFERLLQYLHQTRGFDFTAYKRATLMRRVIRRMQVVNVPSFDEYLDYLQVHQDEFGSLFNTILINVTSFFRDEELWSHLRAHVLPEIVGRAEGRGPIRVWSAGCASGQEPYSLAIAFAEIVGAERLRDRVKIYATDADEEALTEARAGTYSARAAAEVPEDLREKYFERTGTNRTLLRDLRRAVIFGRHDLLDDAPISRVDLLLCRNTLMYFNTDAQARILNRFSFSVKPEGMIVLGRSEMLFSHADVFTPVDLKRRIFKAVQGRSGRERLVMMALASRDVAHNEHGPEVRLSEVAFETDPVAQIVLDPQGRVAGINSAARVRFHLTPRDIGRPIQDLEVSYRPAEIRGAIERAMGGDRRPIKLGNVPWAVDGSLRHFDVFVSPLLDATMQMLGVRLAFQDVTERKELEVQVQHAKQELETAYEELQSTNEELETTNEELQSTIEELETTNEELQSTNEELETMNEELQSTNESLQTINDALRLSSSDLNAANAFLESVFSSLQNAVVVIDREMKVLVWNDRATDLWGARTDETLHRNFLTLDIGLPVADLWQPIRDVLSGAQSQRDLVVPATSRKGRSIDCRLNISPLLRPDRSIGGVIVMMAHVAADQPS